MGKNASTWGVGNPVKGGSYKINPPRSIETYVKNKDGTMSAKAIRKIKQAKIEEINLNGKTVCTISSKSRCGKTLTGSLEWK